MKKVTFDRKRLYVALLSAIAVIGSALYVLRAHKSIDYMLPIFSFCIFAWMYACGRWISKYLEKNPSSSWRVLPYFIQNEKVMNVACFNFYKWVFVMFIIVVLLVKSYS